MKQQRISPEEAQRQKNHDRALALAKQRQKKIERAELTWVHPPEAMRGFYTNRPERYAQAQPATKKRRAARTKAIKSNKK